jgi:peptidoglycan/xylan/chitin deacetylase (PgdA/CDA1 family)
MIEFGYEPDYPDDHTFAICLTHDVDLVQMGMLMAAKTGLVTRSKEGMIGKVKKSMNLLKGCRKLASFDEIFRLEERYDANSSFYFLALEPEDWDRRYDLEGLEQEMGMIQDRGGEVGLHGGYDTYLSQKEVIIEKQRLERVLGKTVKGYRNHYLRFKVPDTWRALESAGLLYDSTFGYAEYIGFRNGACHPFFPYDLERGEWMQIAEVPLAIMDCTLFDYMNLDSTQAWKMVKQLIDTLEQYHGMVSFLWHNTYLKGDGLMLYEKMLSYARSKNAWLTSGIKAYEFMKKNEMIMGSI